MMWYNYIVMYMKKKVKKSAKGKSKNIIYRVIQVLLLIASLFFSGVLIYIDLLPLKYLAIILGFVFGYNLIVFLLFRIKNLKKKIKKVLSVFSVVLIFIFAIGGFYISKTLGILLNNGETKYKLEHYSVIVLKDSDYKKLNDLKGLDVGYYKNTVGAKKANKKLKSETDINLVDYTASDVLSNDLLEGKVEAIVVEDSIKNIIQEENSSFKDVTRIIYTFTIKVKVTSTAKDVNVTKTPFAIYISGIDTYGEISSVSRSDVNMVMVVNPKTKQVLLVSIPRDYYVQLHGTTGVKDKLTHAGIYGTEMSIQTIEDLLQLEINYYIKVNFTSIEDIIDALGGVSVYSEYDFISYSGYSFKTGYNTANGKQALDFVRTRKAFATGDRQRGKNQQALIEAMLRKATSKAIITKYSSLLSSINGKYQTNMSMKKITSLVKMQLNDMSPWNVTSINLSGYDSRNYTYTYYQMLYVMEPDEESVKEAVDAIDKVIEGEVLESSYSGDYNKTSKVSEAKRKPSSAVTNKKPSSAKTNKSPQDNKPQTNTNETNEDIINNQNNEQNEENISSSEDNTEIVDENQDILIPGTEGNPEEDPSQNQNNEDNNPVDQDPGDQENSVNDNSVNNQ